MGLDEEVTPDPNEITFDELHEAFCDLLKEFQKVVSKNKDLKIKKWLDWKRKIRIYQNHWCVELWEKGFAIRDKQTEAYCW